MIPQKYTPYVFSFFMALIMSGIMSLVIPAFNIGLVDRLLVVWLKSWPLAFAVAFPAVVAVSPLVRYLVSVVIAQPRQSHAVHAEGNGS